MLVEFPELPHSSPLLFTCALISPFFDCLLPNSCYLIGTTLGPGNAASQTQIIGRTLVGRVQHLTMEGIAVAHVMIPAPGYAPELTSNEDGSGSKEKGISRVVVTRKDLV